MSLTTRNGRVNVSGSAAGPPLPIIAMTCAWVISWPEAEAGTGESFSGANSSTAAAPLS